MRRQAVNISEVVHKKVAAAARRHGLKVYQVTEAALLEAVHQLESEPSIVDRVARRVNVSDRLAKMSKEVA